jgi:hypothetical protein
MSFKKRNKWAVNTLNREVLSESSFEKLTLLSCSQNTFDGYLACAVCACYCADQSLRKNQQSLTVLTYENAIKAGSLDWVAQHETKKYPVSLQDPVVALTQSKYLGRSGLRVKKEYPGLINDGTFRSITTLEKEMGLCTVSGLIQKLTDKNCDEIFCQPVHIAFCKGRSGAYVYIRIIPNEYYSMVDSHPCSIPSRFLENTRHQCAPDLGMMYETRFIDNFIQFIIERYGGGISDDAILAANVDYVTASKGPNKGADWSHVSIQQSQFSAFQLSCS